MKIFFFNSCKQDGTYQYSFPLLLLLGPGMISPPLDQQLDSFFPAVKLKFNIFSKKSKTCYRSIIPKEYGHGTSKITQEQHYTNLYLTGTDVQAFKKKLQKAFIKSVHFLLLTFMVLLYMSKSQKRNLTCIFLNLHRKT